MPQPTNILLGDLNIVNQLVSCDEQQSHDYAIYDIASGKPTISDIGMNLNNITLTISLRQYLHDIKKILQDIYDMVNSGNAYTFMIGDEYKGEFVIKSIKRQTKNILPDGDIIAIDITLELLEYVQRKIFEIKKIESKPATRKQKTKRQSIGKVEEKAKKQEQFKLIDVQIKNIPESTYVKTIF